MPKFPLRPEYVIVSHATVGGLQTAVNTRMSNGWELVGGPYYDGTKHNQAVSRPLKI